MRTTFNWFYGLIAVLFLSMLYISAKFFKGSGNSSIGITLAKEHRINTEKPSLIKVVHASPGKQVKSGDILIELTSTELEMDIDKLNTRINLLKSEHQEKSKLMEAEIAYVKAQHGITLEEIDTDIEQIKSRQALNRKLTSEFVESSDTASAVANPQQAKMKSLQLQKQKHLRAMEIKIEDIRQESSTDQNLLANQIRLLEREHELLVEEKKKLNKYAESDGVVENVYVKAGEQVAAFTPLLSVNPVRPSTVVGYLVGKKISVPEIGSIVEISSYDKRSTSVKGKVIGFGSVTELPEILQKATAVKAFGREVFIEIGSDNNFANGEKVLIR